MIKTLQFLIRRALWSIIPFNVTAILILAVITPTLATERRLLYVAAPGIRDYLEYGGHGILVFDIDDGHKFVKRIVSGGLDEHGKP